jgi:hypothetical protein
MIAYQDGEKYLIKNENHDLKKNKGELKLG